MKIYLRKLLLLGRLGVVGNLEESFEVDEVLKEVCVLCL